MNNTYYKVWIFFWIDVLLFFVAYYSGFAQFVLQNDTSYISVLIVTLYASSLGVFFLLNTEKKEGALRYIKLLCNYILTTLGLIGTVIGLIYLTGIFTDLDLSDADTARKVIGNMASGMSIALLTTLLGLMTSFSTKIKLALINE